MPWWVLLLLSVFGYAAGFVGTSMVLTFGTKIKDISDIMALSVFWPVTVPVMLAFWPIVLLLDGMAWYAKFLKDTRWKRKIKA